MSARNLFAGADPPASGELVEALCRSGNVVVERIISSDKPEPTIYKQDQDEWVVLLRGRATIEVAGARLDLSAGDHIFLPAQTRHRVLETTKGALWLAVHVHK